MKERPILFSGPMIRAILKNEKVQTRRVCKQADFSRGMHIGGLWAKSVHPARDSGWIAWDGLYADRPEMAEQTKQLYQMGFQCPYGQSGDRLWVRETFVIESNHYTASATEYPPSFADGRPTHWHHDDEDGDWWEQCHYRATDPEPALHYNDFEDPHCRWRPSIFMPRWASRLNLEIVSIKVERVQDISEEDAWAEGVGDIARTLPYSGDDLGRVAFSGVWEGINGKRGYSWESNPWVWAITFKRIA